MNSCPGNPCAAPKTSRPLIGFQDQRVVVDTYPHSVRDRTDADFRPLVIHEAGTAAGKKITGVYVPCREDTKGAAALLNTSPE
jgi:hypothetical protein